MTDDLARRVEAILAQQTRRAWAGGSHWDGCETQHSYCAVGWLLKAISEQDDEIARLRAASQAALAWADTGGMLDWSEVEAWRDPLRDALAETKA